GPWETAREAGKAVALRWAASRRQSQRRVVDDPDPTVAMAEGSGLSVRHDDDALSRTQQPAIDPVVESRLERFGCETVEEPYPAPRSTQPAQQIRHRRRLVTVGLHDGRSPAAQHVSHARAHAPIDRPAVFHDAMPNAGLLEIGRECRGRLAPPMKRHDQAIGPRTLQSTRQRSQLAYRTGNRSGDRFGRNQRSDAFREGAWLVGAHGVTSGLRHRTMGAGWRRS